jgi:hypothetical protein
MECFNVSLIDLKQNVLTFLQSMFSASKTRGELEAISRAPFVETTNLEFHRQLTDVDRQLTDTDQQLTDSDRQLTDSDRRSNRSSSTEGPDSSVHSTSSR